MCKMQMNNRRAEMMRKIMMYGFAIDDVILFLDTHPDDCEARAYFERMRDAYKDLKKEYAEQFGPLHLTDVDAEKYWTWVEDPWPWEGGMC